MADEMNRGVNSKDYWDRRFEQDWESNDGRSYSRAYAKLALELMPDWLSHAINREGLRVCDWGCAEGDGTAVLANAFPAAQVVGVDFAGPAIEKAQKYYPHVDFRCENWLGDETPAEPVCDLLFSSHTLEHFGRPWDVLQKLSTYFTRIAVVLVPFQEQDLIPEHDYSFDFSNIRIKQPCDLDLAACSVVDSGHSRDHCWGGRQVMMVFLRPGDSLWGSLTLADTIVRTSCEDQQQLALEQSILRLENQLEAQQKGFEAQRKDVDTRNQALEKDLTAERDKLARDLQHARATIEQIMGSKSWRITAPLRWAVERLGRGRIAPERGGSTGTAADVGQEDAELPLPKKRTRPTRLKEFRVAAIMDTFTQACFEPECELIQFRPDNWRQVLTENPPDLLFVESAWNGNDGAWQYRVAEYPSPPGRELLDLLAWCKKVEIPTVFWNKEDPSHFDNFIQAACQFEWIFTTDASCIPRYRERCGHDRIHALPFAAQPEIHNPVLKEPRSDKVCFAGTYYGDRFDARRDAMETLLRPALDFDLDIYDRMHGAVGPGTENYRFPQEYVPHIVGRLEYKDMVEAYRRYRVFLNVNSVSDSKTMFSRRVFELLACGTPVVSTESQGIRDMFPGIVPIATDGDEARAAIAELLMDDRSWRRRSALGIRRVMQAHTYSHRLRQLLEMVGFELDSADEAKLTVAVRPGPNPEATASQLMAQTRAPERILLLRNPHADALAKALERIGTAAPILLTERLSDLIERESRNVVGFIDGAHTYGANYLEDAVLALDYSHAHSTSMTAHFELSDDGSTDFVTDLGEANLMSRRVMRACFLCRANLLSPGLVDSIFSKDVLALDTDCYARSPFEFVAGAALEPTDPRVSEALL
jgi:spore maturation protein CgeB